MHCMRRREKLKELAPLSLDRILYIQYSMHISFNKILSTWRVKCWEDTTSMRQGENLIFYKRRPASRDCYDRQRRANFIAIWASEKRNEGRSSPPEKLEISARVILLRRIAVISPASIRMKLSSLHLYRRKWWQESHRYIWHIYSSLQFLITRGGEASPRNYCRGERRADPRWHRRSYGGECVHDDERNTGADAESVILAQWCCFPGVVYSALCANNSELRLINWASHPNCADAAVAPLPGVAPLASSHVSGWIKFLRYTSPMRCTLHRSNYNRTHWLPRMLIIQMSCNRACHTDRDMGTLAVYEVVESKTALNIRKLVFEFLRIISYHFFPNECVACHFAEKKERDYVYSITFFRHGEKSHREWSFYKVAGI